MSAEYGHAVREGVFMSEASTKFQKSIMESAIRLFKEKGYEAVSVNDICKAANIARSTFYLNFAGKKDIIDMILNDVRHDRDDFFGDFVAAANDFERMWILCNRYLTVAIDFGPELTGALFRLELMGELDVLDTTHKVDEWMIQLTANCQKSGVILSPELPEKIAPLGVDIAYYSTYEWCKRKGEFNLRQAVRRRAEAVYNIAAEYRMSEIELAKL